MSLRFGNLKFSVKRDEQVFSVVDLLKGLHDAGLAADVLDNLLVGGAVAEAHALLVDVGQMVDMDCRRVVGVEAQAEFL